MSTRGRPRKYGPANPGKRFLKKNKLNEVQKQDVKQIISRKLETKMFNSGSGAYGLDSGVDNIGSIHDLSNIFPTGTTQGLRVGREISLVKHVFTAEITLSQSSFISADAYNTVRIILFRWREDSASKTPVLSDILDTASVATCYPTQFPYNYNQREQYHIVWDKLIKVAPDTVYDGSGITYSASGINVTKIFTKTRFGKKLGAMKIQYDNDVNGHGYNKLYALFLSDSTVAPDPTVAWATQLYYKDA